MRLKQADRIVDMLEVESKVEVSSFSIIDGSVDDTAIVFTAQQGQQWAMVQLIDKYQGLLKNTARRYASVVTFEEVYQEACVAFLRCIQSYNSTLGVPFSAFAFFHVRGDVRTAMRRLWRYNSHLEVVATRESDDSPNESWDTGSLFDSNQARESMTDETAVADYVIEQMMWCTLLERSGLSPKERVYVVETLSGKKLGEIAATHQVSVETVKTWRKRALRKLRKALAEMERD